MNKESALLQEPIQPFTSLPGTPNHKRGFLALRTNGLTSQCVKENERTRSVPPIFPREIKSGRHGSDGFSEHSGFTFVVTKPQEKGMRLVRLSI